MKNNDSPDLNSSCGRYFNYRDFIECGETQQGLGTPNKPQQSETYIALYKLASELVDPVIDQFGMVELTFGFCSSSLSAKIKGRIAPKLDQHASFELNRLGNRICARDGAAVDFILRDQNMFEVSQWIVETLEFDRLYFYGPDRPIHVSHSQSPSKQVTIMKESVSSNRRIPRTCSDQEFLRQSASPIDAL